MVDPEAVYLRLPVVLQQAACSFVGWRTERTRYGGAFPRLLSEAEARTYWSREQIRSYRNARLADFVEHAATTVPFYRERFREAGVDPREVRSLDDMSAIPVLAKGEIQERSADLVSPEGMTGDSRWAHTSGTTGGGLRFPVTLAAAQEQWATWWRYRGWHGIAKGTWAGLFAGRSIVPSSQRQPPFWRLNAPGRQLLFSGYHMSPANLPAYVEELRRRKLPWLHGYPSLLALLAAHLIEARTDLGYEVQWVTIGAENLLPHQVSLMERAFGVRPRQHYGLAEGVANISECEVGSLHVDEDYAAVEFVPTETEGACRIVGTNFTNRAAPLLRYDTQDVASVSVGASCSCGRPGRVVQQVDGRLEDYVVLGDGTRIGRMDHIFKDMVNIQEAQIHQSRPGALTIRVVRGAGYTDADEQALLAETVRRVGSETDVAFEYVTSLARSRTGKLRFVVSEIPAAAIRGAPSTGARA
ncbi:MAG: hypothetical protein M3322_07110 [Actinomycetota bacterium]|nr:hypothetical protein [Actinomycetota bacterium]